MASHRLSSHPEPHLGFQPQSSLELFIAFIHSMPSQGLQLSLMLFLLMVHRIKPLRHFLHVISMPSALECFTHSACKVAVPHFIVQM